jgi:hypothetical protein
LIGVKLIPICSITYTWVLNYILEHKVNGIWLPLNENISINSTSVPLEQGPDFRIITCHQYGCSSGQVENNSSDVPVQIRSFASSNYNNGNVSKVSLSWDIAGASRVQLTSSKGHNYDNLNLISSLNVSTEDLTTFTLRATGFGVSKTQTLSVIKPVTLPKTHIPQPSIYSQPLINLNLQPIERSIITGVDNVSYVADLKNQIHKISDTGKILWTRQLQGLMANKPVILSDVSGVQYLFFALSKSSLDSQSSHGQVCRVTVDNTNYSCYNLDNNAIASPAIYHKPGASASTAKLYQLDVKGVLYELNPFHQPFSLTNSQTLLINDASIRVLSTPQVDYKNGLLIVRTEKNEVVSYQIAEPQTSFSKNIDSLTQGLSINKPQTNAVWSRKLD